MLLQEPLALLDTSMEMLLNRYLISLLAYSFGDQVHTIKSEPKINKAVLFSDAGAANFD